jgi:hypothetical protein
MESKSQNSGLVARKHRAAVQKQRPAPSPPKCTKCNATTHGAEAALGPVAQARCVACLASPRRARTARTRADRPGTHLMPAMRDPSRVREARSWSAVVNPRQGSQRQYLIQKKSDRRGWTSILHQAISNRYRLPSRIDLLDAASLRIE